MPIIKDTESITALRPEASPFYSTSVDTATVVSDFWKSENSMSNLAQGISSLVNNRFEPDVDYDPVLDMDGYEGYANNLSGAQSQEEMIYLKSKIDEENRRRETVAASNGWQMAAGIATLIATDPLSAIPVGGVAYNTFRTSGRILQGAAKTAAVGAGVETANEAIIQFNQETRTGEESFTNIGLSTFLGGVLGGASGALSKPEYNALLSKLDSDLTTATEQHLSTVGAAQVGTTLDDEAIKGLTKTKAVWDKMPAFMKNPVFENALSPSKYVREINEKLSDLSLVKNKNTNFIASEASVETLIKGYQTLEVPFFKAEAELYKAYKMRVKNNGLSDAEKIGSRADGSLTRNEFNEQVWQAGINNDTHIIKEVEDLSKATRKNVFDPILKRSEEVGIFENIDEMDVKTADSWMKRMYDTDKIVKNRNDFKRIVVDDLIEKRNIALDELNKLKASGEKTDDALKQISRLEFKSSQSLEEIDDIAEQLIDRITNATAGRLPYDMKLEGKSKGGKLGVRGSAKARVWDIKDEKIKDFLVKDVRAIVRSHIATMSADNEIMGKFGTLDFDVVKKQIQEDYNRIRGAKVKDKKTGEYRKKTNKELADVDKSLKKDIRNASAMWDKLRGTYAQPDDYTSPIHTLERTALGLNFVRLLGDMVASSVPDMARPVMVHGFSKSYGKLMKTLVNDIKGFKMAKDEMIEIGTALDITNSMTSLRRANMDEYTPVGGKVDDITQRGSAFFAMATGMNHWNATMKTFSGIITQNRMLEAIDEFATTGKLGKKEIENLASHGIGKKEAIKIAEQFKKYGETRSTLRIANAREWDDTATRNMFRNAVRKQVDEIIVTPGLDRPLWMSRPGWKTIGQFKSFSFAATQRVLMAGMQQADANMFVGVSAGIMVGSLVYAYKSMLSGREVSDDPRKWIVEGIDRSGVTGIAMEANNIVEKVTGGAVGLNAMTGGAPMSRYASRNVAGALLGPSFGLANDVFRTTSSISSGNVSKSDIHAMRRILPMQNIPYLRGLFDRAEESISSAIVSE